MARVLYKSIRVRDEREKGRVSMKIIKCQIENLKSIDQKGTLIEGQKWRHVKREKDHMFYYQFSQMSWETSGNIMASITWSVK